MKNLAAAAGSRRMSPLVTVPASLPKVSVAKSDRDRAYNSSSRDSFGAMISSISFGVFSTVVKACGDTAPATAEASARTMEDRAVGSTPGRGTRKGRRTSSRSILGRGLKGRNRPITGRVGVRKEEEITPNPFRAACLRRMSTASTASSSRRLRREVASLEPTNCRALFRSRSSSESRSMKAPPSCFEATPMAAFSSAVSLEVLSPPPLPP
mmetsp:Transcript_17837/g.26016  ORF Transcript_17837/g.26016 Transcript_17837/m.26016 type:complete len:211 (+) Transcript_17837:743-1375(+)